MKTKISESRRSARAKAFKAFKDSLGLTLEGFAWASGIGHATVCSWNLGHMPGAETMRKLNKKFRENDEFETWIES